MVTGTLQENLQRETCDGLFYWWTHVIIPLKKAPTWYGMHMVDRTWLTTEQCIIKYLFYTVLLLLPITDFQNQCKNHFSSVLVYCNQTQNRIRFWKFNINLFNFGSNINWIVLITKIICLCIFSFYVNFFFLLLHKSILIIDY